MRRISVLLILGLIGFVPTGCSKTAAPSKESTTVGNKIGYTKDGAVRKQSETAVDGFGPATKGVPEPAAPTSVPKGDFGGVPTETGGKKAPLKEEPSAPAPALAEAVVGKAHPAKMKPKPAPSGILTAGSFDDNIEPQYFTSFARRFSQQRGGLGELASKLQSQRLLLMVRDVAGKPLGNARVKLSAGPGTSAEITTRSDGRAVFLLGWDQIATGQDLTATVVGANGVPLATEVISANVTRWEITVPTANAVAPTNLDLAIVLDTTGSMGDELTYLKNEIRGIAAAVAKQYPNVKQRYALILYRDEGDEYVVRRFDFTESLNEFHRNLSAQSAAGGGDYPEAMHKGLKEAEQLRWKEADSARVLFLIGDAPPHAQHMNSTLQAANQLRKNGVAIYPIACSGYDDACEFVMRSCAMLTGSQFLFLTDDSGVGNSHAEPSIPYYQVEHLDRLLVRIIGNEISGQHTPPQPVDIVRNVGKKVN